MRIIVILVLTNLIFVDDIASQDIKTSKDWYWGTAGENVHYAGTVNSNNQVFGQYCFIESDSCLYLIDLSTACEVGDQYPALLSSDKGSAHVTLYCYIGNSNENYLAFTNFADIDSVVKLANSIGIAIALDNLKFKVIRFSLSGSTYAIEKMLSAAEMKQEMTLPAEEIL